MKFILLRLLLLPFIIQTASGQPLQTILIPKYQDWNAHAVIFPGIYTTVITNNSSHSVSIYPLLNRPGMEHIIWGEDSLISYLLSQVVGMRDTDAIRLKLMQTAASKIEKTDLFMNKELLYRSGNDSNLSAKQNSIIGSTMGVYHKQCGDYVSNATAMLLKTGYFDDRTIQIVHLIAHGTCQFWYRGGWAFADLDPNMPFFMIADSANPNGFASAKDLHDNRNLITPDQEYRYVNGDGDSMRLFSVSIPRYKSKFDSVSLLTVDFIKSLNIPGIITLPAKASLVASNENTDYDYLLIEDLASVSAFTDLYLHDATDSIYGIFSKKLGIPLDSAKKVPLSEIHAAPAWEPDYRGFVPTVEIVLPPSKDTVKIQAQGKNSINFAGYILSSTVTIHLPDTVFQPGEHPLLWSDASGHNAFFPSNGMINYLSGGGFIAPHSGSDTITLSYNPIILNFDSGCRFDYVPGDSVVVRTLFNNKPVATDSTHMTGLCRTNYSGR